MPLKEEARSTTRDLGNGEAGEWMGYSLRKGEDGLIARPSSRGWDHLEEGLTKAHLEEGSPLRAIECIEGWFDQQGPCYRHVNVDEAYARMAGLAREHAFEELPDRDGVRARWARADGRWGRLREGARLGVGPAGIGGSAPLDF